MTLGGVLRGNLPAAATSLARTLKNPLQGALIKFKILFNACSPSYCQVVQ